MTSITQGDKLTELNKNHGHFFFLQKNSLVNYLLSVISLYEKGVIFLRPLVFLSLLFQFNHNSEIEGECDDAREIIAF